MLRPIIIAALLLSACGDGSDIVDQPVRPGPKPPPEDPYKPNLDMVQSAEISAGMRSCYGPYPQQLGEAVVGRWDTWGGNYPSSCMVLNANGRWPNIHSSQWYDASYMADNLRIVSIFIPKNKCGGIKLYHGTNYSEGHQYNLWHCSDPSGPGDGTLWNSTLSPSASSIKTLLYDCPNYPWCPTPPSDW